MNDLRIVVVVRNDLNMPMGKFGVQVGHAVASTLYLTTIHGPYLAQDYMAYQLLDYQPRTSISSEIDSGQTKIIVGVDSLDELLKIRDKAIKRCVYHSLIKDAAKTFFSEPTITCLGLGPMTKTDSNYITRGLRTIQ